MSVILALSIAAQTYLSMMGHGHSFTRIMLWQMACWSLWAFVAPWVVDLGSRVLSTAPLTVRDGLMVAGTALAFGIMHNAVATLLTLWLQPFIPVVASGFAPTFVNQVRSLFALDLLVFSLLFMGGGSYAAVNRARRLELRESRLEAELTRAQLEALRLEIQPHFLFNVLNSIAALIRVKDNTRALDMLVSLSELMRSTLERPADQLTPLGGELDFVRRYVALQQSRFDDRLVVDYLVDPTCVARQVPVFLLQPLVENAIRHGAQLSRRYRIEIGASGLENGALRLWVSDDGRGLPPGFDLSRDAGTGLTNTRSRLEQLYDGRAALSIYRNDAGGATVELMLPALPARSNQAGAA